MSDRLFRLPDVGEGLTEAEIVAWRVGPGDEIELNQVIVEIETAKSLVELPSPFAGTIGRLLVEEGMTVEVGSPIVEMGADPAAEGDPDADGDPGAVASATRGGGAPRRGDEATEGSGDGSGSETADAEPAGAEAADPDPAGEGSVLVGYGTVGTAGSRRRLGGGTPSVEPLAAGTDRPGAPQRRHVPSRDAMLPVTHASSVLAKPPIRRLAKDLGVDLTEVAGTGIGGEVTRDDVVREASQASVFRNIATPAWPDEREERIPVRGVRKAIAHAMTTSAYTAPHVSLFVDVDASRTMEFVRRLRTSPDFAGIKVSPLLIMARAIVWAVQRNPTVNSSWTDEEIVVHHYVNLGVAAATPRGLLVPNVKEAQALTLLELAERLERLTIDARDGRTPPADMQRGTITVTNIGVFGMDAGTPILNPGEVAIVALGTIKQKPWVVDGEVRPRAVTTLAASFDHRVVDGDVASRFMADVASILEEPALLLE